MAGESGTYWAGFGRRTPVETPPETFGGTPPASGEQTLVHGNTASGPPQDGASANAELSVVP